MKKFKISDFENALLDTLNDFQRDQYDTVKWLFGIGPRGSGRTHLLAVTFIIHAVYTGMRVHVSDHYPTGKHREARFILQTIDKICCDNGIIMGIYPQEGTIMFKRFDERWTNHLVEECKHCGKYHDTRIACREYGNFMKGDKGPGDMFKNVFEAMNKMRDND